MLQFARIRLRFSRQNGGMARKAADGADSTGAGGDSLTGSTGRYPSGTQGYSSHKPDPADPADPEGAWSEDRTRELVIEAEGPERLGKSLARVRQVNVKLSDDDHSRLARVAKRYGLRPTALARVLIMRGVAAALGELEGSEGGGEPA